MIGTDRICKEPCVSVVILNSHPIRGAIEILKGINAKTMTIDFYKDRFIILHQSENQRCNSKIEIKKNKLFLYSFNPFEVDGKVPTRISVTVGVDLFMESIKTEKKQDSCFNVLCSYNSSSAFIIFSQERSGSACEKQPCVYSLDYEMERDDSDPYHSLYIDYDENATMTEKDLESNISRYRGTKCQNTKVRLRESGIINLSAIVHGGKKITVDLPSSYMFPEDEDEDVDENAYIINLSANDLANLAKVKKLGPSNTIRAYMSIDYPLLFRALIWNYGEFLIWFVSN